MCAHWVIYVVHFVCWTCSMRLYIYIILYYCTLVTICISPQCALKIEFYRKLESFTCTFHLLDSQQVFVGFLLVLGGRWDSHLHLFFGAILCSFNRVFEFLCRKLNGSPKRKVCYQMGMLRLNLRYRIRSPRIQISYMRITNQPCF